MKRINIKRVKPKEKPKKSTLEKKMVILSGNIIKAKADNKCAVCEYLGEKEKRYYGQSINAHHIIGKNCLYLRYDLRNGIALCVSHHKFGKLSAHKGGVWFTRILETIRAEDLPYLEEHQHDVMQATPIQWYRDKYEELEKSSPPFT